MALPHVLLVDDDGPILTLLSRFLREHGWWVSRAQSAKEARQCLALFMPDIMVTDVMMPGETGLMLAEALRKDGMMLPMLILTAMDAPKDRIAGLEVGADDYLTKPFEPRELLLRLERILYRVHQPAPKKRTDEAIISFGAIAYHIHKGYLIKQEKIIPLTTAEITLFQWLLKHKSTLVTREQLAAVGGGIHERSVDVQMKRLRQKIEPNPKQPLYLQSIRGQGYILFTDS